MPKRSKENDSRRMLKHLSAILEKSGVIIFEYHIKTDTLIRYDKELKVEVKIPVGSRCKDPGILRLSQGQNTDISR